ALASGEAGPPALETQVFVLSRHRPANGTAYGFVEADLNNPEGLHKALHGIEPDFVIHTAGKTRPASDEELYKPNFWSTPHPRGALRRIGRPMRIVLAGSAAELGPVEEARLPVDESYPADPVDGYGRSKWMATRSGLAERHPLEVVAARIFNPIG